MATSLLSMATQSIYPDDPKLKDLVYELKEVDWKQLGIQLDIPRHVLKNIDRENPGNESRKLSEVLQYWIDNESAVSWEKIMEALQRIGGHANIMANIQSKYMIGPLSISEAEEVADYVITRILSLVERLIKFPVEILDSPCTASDLAELSQSVDNTKDLSLYLRLNPVYQREKKALSVVIPSAIPSRPTINMLRIWQDKFGVNASYRLLITALHEANEMDLVDKLQLMVLHIPRFPGGFLDILCEDVILDKLNYSSTDQQELSLLDFMSNQRQVIHTATSKTSCIESLQSWRQQYKKKANYRTLIAFFNKVNREDLIDELLEIINLHWYGDYLKKEYVEVLFTSQVSAYKWLPSPTQKIFNLAIIKKDKIQRGNIDNEFVYKTIRGQVDDILLEKAPVKLKDLFKNADGDRKVILIDGAPGSGKSTLTVHICQQWGIGELFNEFTVVILVQLRDPKVQSATSIVDLLPCEDSAMAEQAAAEIKAIKGINILWVLDGWDELPLSLQSGSIISALVKPEIRGKNPLPKTSVIVTSRPISSGDLFSWVSSRIEVLGFTAEEQRLFFIECLEDIEAVDVLMERLNGNPVMEGSCYLPLNASIVAHLYLANGSLPSTIYGMFSSLVQHCLSRYLYERQGISCELASFESMQELPLKLRRPCEQLGMVAYTGAKDNNVTFSTSCFAASETCKEICELGLLQAVPSIVSHGRLVYYNFLHLSIQEMLAAVGDLWGLHIQALPLFSIQLEKLRMGLGMRLVCVSACSEFMLHCSFLDAKNAWLESLTLLLP